jgi:hypothetical protein
MDMHIPAPSCVSRRHALTLIGAFAASPALANTPVPLTMYRDAGCGCCLKWGDHARKAGFAVHVVDQPDMAALKTRIGIPQALWSCHTAMVERHLVEGHVPLAAVKRMLALGGKAPLGIAVPGMPIGSPGMEVSSGRTDKFEIIAFAGGGRTWPFT